MKNEVAVTTHILRCSLRGVVLESMITLLSLFTGLSDLPPCNIVESIGVSYVFIEKQLGLCHELEPGIADK